MKKPILIIMLFYVLVLFNGELYPQKIRPLMIPKKFELGLKYSTFTSSSYYATNDSLVRNGIDTFALMDDNGNYLGDTALKYVHDFYKTTIGLEFRYMPTQRITFSANLPLSFYRLEEKYFRDQSGYRAERANLSRTRLDYFETGAKYGISQDNFLSGIFASLRIPSGFEKGQAIYTDADSISERTFLSDGALEILLGAEFGIKAKTFAWENIVVYNYRAEDFRDQLIVMANLGFSTVPNTKFSLFVLSKLSLSSFDNIRQFIPGEEVLIEDNISAGAEFEMFLTDELIGRINYNVSLYGKNTWNGGHFNFYLGYRF